MLNNYFPLFALQFARKVKTSAGLGRDPAPCFSTVWRRY